MLFRSVQVGGAGNYGIFIQGPEDGAEAGEIIEETPSYFWWDEAMLQGDLWCKDVKLFGSGSPRSVKDELTSLDGNKAAAVYALTSMADFYEAVMDGGLILFAGSVALWQALTTDTGNFSCYGIGRKEGSLAVYTVMNGPGTKTYKGRLTSATTIGKLAYYAGQTII